MQVLRGVIDYGIFAGVILLGFLVLFEPFLEVPAFVLWLGHWHPVVLHFPIVLVFVTIFLYWKKEDSARMFIGLTTLFAILTALTGLLLSLESGSKGQLILTHQWLGVGFACLLAIWYWISRNTPTHYHFTVILQISLVILVLLTGHFGGMVTHGNDFLSLNLAKGSEEDVRLPDDPIIYAHIIQPILDTRCVSCHNQNKAKGELVLVDYSSLKSGGSSGLAIDLQDPAGSELLRRIMLPLDDEDHMPPGEEDQLTPDEMTLLKEWVLAGADEEKKFSEIDSEKESFQLIQTLIEKSLNMRWSHLPEVRDNSLNQLNSDYLTISRMYDGSNALQMIIYPHKDFNHALLADLKAVSGNIVELDLSGLPLETKDFKFIGQCKNIERLDISRTPVDAELIGELKDLEYLRELKVYYTQLTDESLNTIAEFPALKGLYVLGTQISGEAIEQIRNEKPGLTVIKSTDQASEFRSVLPPPSVEPAVYFFNEMARIKLNHPMKDIDLYYTLDGSEPDESSSIASDCLVIMQSSRLKFLASRAGWVSSPVDSMLIFKTIEMPDKYSLFEPPDPAYVGRGKKLLFDLEKGPQNFRDSSWMAFRETDMILFCEWEEPVRIRSVVLSSIIDTDPYLFPPESLIIKGGTDKYTLKVLGSWSPSPLHERTEGHFEYYECDFDPVEIRFLEIVVRPLQKIPFWHSGKGEKGWFFIDEIVIEPDLLTSS